MKADACHAATEKHFGRPGALGCIEPLMGIEDLAAALNCSRRAVERLRSAGRLPRPDLTLGRLPRRKAATIRAWIDSGGKGVG